MTTHNNNFDVGLFKSVFNNYVNYKMVKKFGEI